MSTVSVDAKIIQIVEDSFFIDREKLSDNIRNIIPCFSLSFHPQKDELLLIRAFIKYADDLGNSIAETKFRIILKIQNINNFVRNSENGEDVFEFPDGFLDTLVRDTYATGRVLSSRRFIGTKFADLYLPLQGAEKMIEIMKHNSAPNE